MFDGVSVSNTNTDTIILCAYCVCFSLRRTKARCALQCSPFKTQTHTHGEQYTYKQKITNHTCILNTHTEAGDKVLKAQEDCRERGMNSDVMDGVTDRGQRGRGRKEGVSNFKAPLKLQNAFLNMHIFLYVPVLDR